MKGLPLLTLSVMLLFVVMSSCSDEIETSEAYTHSLYDLVTYMGSSDGTTQFELVGRDNSSRMLTASITMDSSVKVLQRVLLRYYWEDESAGTIKVYGMSLAITDSLRYSTAPLSLYARHPVKMRSAWRTGDFINLHCQVEYTGKSRTFMLLIDDATRNEDTVQCYLHHDIHDDTTYHWRECYASFNVGNVWKRTECSTLRVHVTDADEGELSYDFAR